MISAKSNEYEACVAQHKCSTTPDLLNKLDRTQRLPYYKKVEKQLRWANHTFFRLIDRPGSLLEIPTWSIFPKIPQTFSIHFTLFSQLIL